MRKLLYFAVAAVVAATVWFLTPLSAGDGGGSSAICRDTDAAGRLRLRQVDPQQVGIDPSRLSCVDQAVMRSIDSGDAPGAVLCVVRHGCIACLRAYGNRRVVPDTVAMSEDTVFDLASLTKVVATNTAVMQLVEQGRLRLGDRVDRYIAGFEGWRNPDDVRDTTHIRIIDLMTHTSGLPAYVRLAAVAAECPGRSFPDRDATIGYIAHCRRISPPHEEYRYSCLNYVTLQHVVECVCGESIDRYAAEHIFRPLGMADTRFLPDAELSARCAPTIVDADEGVLCGVVQDPLARQLCGGVSGNAGLFSTAEDLAVFVQTMLSGGEHCGVRVLSPLAVKAIATVPRGYEEFGRTLGWESCCGYSSTAGDLLSPSAYFHTGFTGTSIVIDPALDLGIILLTNRVHPCSTGSVARMRAEVANAVAGAIVEL
ncbi:MAG: serine hydrolase [Alistipes sp.]|nr:serine hydrolase [Alistipes sp.]